MRIIFHDAEGVKHWRTLTRTNVRKVAWSVHKVYKGTIPISHIIGALENSFNLLQEVVEFRCYQADPVVVVIPYSEDLVE